MSPFLSVLYAFIGGILPALLWLWFFLREDKLHPEPKRLLALTFLLGLVAVLVVLPLEILAQCAYLHLWPPAPFSILSTFSFCEALQETNPILLWAMIEELTKYLIVALFILWRKEVDEPLDMMVYLFTIALGFSAFETTLFLLDPLLKGDLLESIVMGNLRFVGASLIHTLASGVLGFCLALSFYKSTLIRFFSVCTGLILAITLHSLFNHHILTTNKESMAVVFFFVWFGIIILFLLFERAKRVTRPSFR